MDDIDLLDVAITDFGPKQGAVATIPRQSVNVPEPISENFT